MNNINNYKNRWLSLFVNNDEKIYIDSFNYILKKYSERHRKYHNFDHILSSLILFDSVREKISNPWTFEIAIWYHDLIYNIFSIKNELRSAEAAIKFLNKVKIGNDEINIVYDLILSTTHRNQPKTKDEKYIMDIDLSILGSTQSEFINYENKIRKEYIIFPSFIYKKQRTIILKSFLEKEKIYFTQEFYLRYEEKARNNIKYLLDVLK